MKCTYAGESCGNGQTLAELKHRIKEQKLQYNCYDVFGDPKDQSQWKDLSVCTSKIISAVQQGTTPEINECFLAENGRPFVIMWCIYMYLYRFYFSDKTSPVGPIVGGVLGGIGALVAVVIILSSFLFVLRHKFPVNLLVSSRTRRSSRKLVSTVAYSRLSKSDAESE